MSELSLSREKGHLPCISPTSPLHLPYISPTSPLHLPCISLASPYISPTSQVRELSLGREKAAAQQRSELLERREEELQRLHEEMAQLRARIKEAGRELAGSKRRIGQLELSADSSAKQAAPYYTH